MFSPDNKSQPGLTKEALQTAELVLDPNDRDVQELVHELSAEARFWDRVGIFLSGLCALHCMLTPILMLALPVVGEVFEQAWVHIAMAIFVVPVGLWAFVSGHRRHHQFKVLALGTLGVVIVGAAALMPLAGIRFFADELITIVGSVCLITAHIMNRQACSCHTHTHSSLFMRKK